MAALHEEAGAADRERLLDLLEDHGLRQQIALARVAGAPVERAEVAVRVADVGVVDVAVDDERHAGRIRPAGTKLVGGMADRDEVARLEQYERVLVGDTLAGERLLEHIWHRHGNRAWHAQAGTPSATKRSSGTSVSSSAPWASSRNV